MTGIWAIKLSLQGMSRCHVFRNWATGLIYYGSQRYLDICYNTSNFVQVGSGAMMRNDDGPDPLAVTLAIQDSSTADAVQAAWQGPTFKRGFIPEIAPPPEFCT